jgi:hypothetical protein
MKWDENGNVKMTIYENERKEQGMKRYERKPMPINHLLMDGGPKGTTHQQNTKVLYYF